MGSPTTTLNGRLAPSIATLPPHVQRQMTLETLTFGKDNAPLLNYKSPIGSIYDNPSAQPLHPGCVLCGYVASASAQSPSAPSSPANQPIPLPSPIRSATPDLHRPGPSSGSSSSGYHPVASPITSPTTLKPLHLVQQHQNQRETTVSGHRIIYRDAFLTCYPAEGKEALCKMGRHIIIIINHHLSSVYELGPGDIPILSHIINTATRLLLQTVPTAAEIGGAPPPFSARDVRVGFVNGMPRDPRFPYPHLHAQAFLGPFDKTLPGSTLWRRNVVYGNLNWWSVDDLRAEIREETSNNRIKSGYEDRLESPIDKVPDAGAMDGLPNALDPTCQSPEVMLSSEHDPMAESKAKAKEKAKQRAASPLRTESPTKPANSDYAQPADNSSISSTETR